MRSRVKTVGWWAVAMALAAFCALLGLVLQGAPARATGGPECQTLEARYRRLDEIARDLRLNYARSPDSHRSYFSLDRAANEREDAYHDLLAQLSAHEAEIERRIWAICGASPEPALESLHRAKAAMAEALRPNGDG